MHKLKELYSSPASELLVIRFEESVMSPGNPGGDDTIVDDDENY